MDDRRRYFRIDDNVSLKYRVVQDTDIENEINRTEHQRKNVAELKTAFNCIEAKIMSKMKHVEEVSPLIAEILGLYDVKLSLLQNMIIQEDDKEFAVSETHRVNLSASGMSFESNTPINEGANIKMEIVLLPSYDYIPAYAKVVDCKKKIDDNLYRFSVAVDFTGISEKDREKIVQHILSKQAKSLKDERRKKQENEEQPKAANG